MEKIENPEINFDIYSQLIFDQDAKQSSWEKIAFSVNFSRRI